MATARGVISPAMIHPLGAFAEKLADASSAAILPHYRSRLTIENKARSGSIDPVTIADRAAEAAIRALINAHYPEHGIIGEEFGIERADAAHVWVIDPIDGTKAFISGMLTWGTLIGLLHHGEPVLGVVDQPYCGERYFGNGQSAIVVGRSGQSRLRTRKATELRDAIIWVSSTVTTQPELFARVQRLVGDASLLRYGSDCMCMAMLAEGHIDAVIEVGLEIYDIAAQVPVVLGAGGIFTSLEGGNPLTASAILAAGHPRLHAQMLEHLRQPLPIIEAPRPRTSL